MSNGRSAVTATIPRILFEPSRYGSLGISMVQIRRRSNTCLYSISNTPTPDHSTFSFFSKFDVNQPTNLPPHHETSSIQAPTPPLAVTERRRKRLGPTYKVSQRQFLQGYTNGLDF